MLRKLIEWLYEITKAEENSTTIRTPVQITTDEANDVYYIKLEYNKTFTEPIKSYVFKHESGAEVILDMHDMCPAQPGKLAGIEILFPQLLGKKNEQDIN